MFFKGSRKRLMVVAFILPGLITCAREHEPRDPVIQVQLKGGGRCLSDFSGEVRRFMDGRMAPGEVIGFWDCAAAAVNDFERLTAGESGLDIYTPQALRRFLYKHFLESRVLSDGLLKSVMEFKRVLLSGSSAAITRAELRRLNDLMSELKMVSLEIHPHVSVLARRGPPPTDTELDQAFRAFTRAAQRLGAWLDLYRQPYDFEQVRFFVTALKEWMIEGGDEPEFVLKLERALVALGPAKRLLVGGSDAAIDGREWVRVFGALGRLLRIFGDLQFAFAADLNSGLSRELVPDALAELAALGHDVIRERGGRGVPLSEWDELFTRLGEGGLLPPEIAPEAAAGAFRWLVERALGEGRPTAVLKLEHTHRLAHQAGVWRALLRQAVAGGEPAFPEWTRFKAVLSASQPLEWDTEGRLIHSSGGGVGRWTPENIRRMVWPFLILDWLRGAYAGRAEHLTEEQLSGAVGEILPMLQRFGWLADTRLSIGRRLFREADLFTLASNGNAKLELGEAVRYLAFVASAYRSAEMWLEEGEKRCGSREANCLRSLATRAESAVLAPFENLRRQVLSEPPENFVGYMRAAEETVLGAVVRGDFGAKDLLQVVVLFQYVETFLRVYDRSSDQRIDLSESLEAYEIYGPTLARLLSRSGLPPDEVLAFFTFMMKYGDTPFAMFGGQVYFMNWKLHRNDWAFLADRRVLMNILNQLSKL